MRKCNVNIQTIVQNVQHSQVVVCYTMTLKMVQNTVGISEKPINHYYRSNSLEIVIDFCSIFSRTAYDFRKKKTKFGCIV